MTGLSAYASVAEKAMILFQKQNQLLANEEMAIRLANGYKPRSGDLTNAKISLILSE